MLRVTLHLRPGEGPPSAEAAGAITIDRFPFVIGRHPRCDWRIDKPEISRRHCSLVLYRGRILVQDLDSTNGTYLNGSEARAFEELSDADRLRLGTLVFEVQLEREGVTPAPGHP